MQSLHKDHSLAPFQDLGQAYLHRHSFHSVLDTNIANMMSSYLIAALVAGASAIPAPATDFTLNTGNSALSSLAKRQSVNYNQDYIASGANVQYTPNQGAGSFSVNYNTQQDFVVGLGWKTGDTT
jgi:hypothetical protein